MPCRFGQLRNSSVFTYSTHSTALLQAVLQVNTEPFWKGLVETRIRAVGMNNGLGTVLVPVQFFILKWDPPSISPIIQLIQTQIRLLTAVFNFRCDPSALSTNSIKV